MGRGPGERGAGGGCLCTPDAHTHDHAVAHAHTPQGTYTHPSVCIHSGAHTSAQHTPQHECARAHTRTVGRRVQVTPLGGWVGVDSVGSGFPSRGTLTRRHPPQKPFVRMMDRELFLESLQLWLCSGTRNQVWAVPGGTARAIQRHTVALPGSSGP